MLAQPASVTGERRILQQHFALFYRILAGSRLVPNASFERIGDIQRCLSGIPSPYYNGILGLPQSDWNACIDEQFNYFNKAKLPFTWYLDEGASLEFKTHLINRGFQDIGVFRGVIGALNKPIPSPEVPQGYTLELVKDAAALDEFNDLLCTSFGFHGVTKEFVKIVLESATKNPQYPMFHWLARKQGKVVAILSTLIEGEIVSFWNGASLPEVRRQGLSTALRHLALRDAMTQGCRLGISYLMTEGMALGICNKLGYQTKWKFNVFVAPENENT
jgi:hypothetical protein